MVNKTIVSFDVGVKNLAYCILNPNNNIQDWKVLNIIEKSENNEENIKCSCKNGISVESKDCSEDNTELCESCNSGYKLNNKLCIIKGIILI